jgi:hypothetical protein
MIIKIEKDSSNFKPLTLTLKIETVEELNSLIARLAVTHDEINKCLDEQNYTINVQERAKRGATFDLFTEIYKFRGK